MKIIGVSNSNDETVSDCLVCENVRESLAEEICNDLNKKYCGEYDGTHFKMVPDDYKLYHFEY